jgi:hypothetical protein
MHQELTTKDAPKIALVIGLLLAILTGGWMAKNRVECQREETRMADRMDREADMPEMTRAIKANEEVEIDPEKQLLVHSNAQR